MNKLLESLDSAIFTDELKANIQAKFASKVVEIEDNFKGELEDVRDELSESKLTISELTNELKEVKIHAQAYAEKVVAEAISETEASNEAAILDYKAKAQSYGEYIAEQYKTRAEGYVEYIKEELIKTVSSYLDLVVTEYIENNRVSIDESVQIEKAKAMLEGLDSVIETAGISVIELKESMIEKTPVVPDDSLNDIKAKLDSLIKENAELKKNIANKEKESIIESIAGDLTLVQRDRFDRLAKVVSVNEDKDLFKESLMKIKAEILDKVEEPAVIVEKQVSVAQVVDKSYSRFI